MRYTETKGEDRFDKLLSRYNYKVWAEKKKISFM